MRILFSSSSLIPIPAGSTDFFPQGFDSSPVDFALQAFCFGISGRAGGFAFFGCGEDAFNQIPKSDQRIPPVFPLGSVLLRLDDDDAFPRDAMVSQFQETFLDEIRKGRGIDVKPQMHSGGNLVDILPPRPLGPNGMDFDFTKGDGNMV